MAFSDHYPLAAFAAIADASWWRSHDFERPKDPQTIDRAARSRAETLDNADRKRVEDHRRTVLEPAIRAHLDGLRAAGTLKPTGGLAGRRVWQASAWNAYVAGAPDDHETAWLMELFATGVFTHTFVRMDPMRRDAERMPGEHAAPSPELIEAAWRRICTDMDVGTSRDSHMGWGMEAQDAATGDRCEMAFVDWTGVLMRRNERHDLEPAQDVGALPLSKVEIDVPTGRLLLTDTLRVEGFSEGSDFADGESFSRFSLNSAKGRLARTEAHAERHGFAYCQTTNTCVPVFRHDATGDIAVVHAGREGMKGWTKVGDVSCDVWRLTMIDRSTAIRVMTDGGNAGAEAELDRYLALADQPDVWTGEGDWSKVAQSHHEQCYSRNVLRLDVAPGRWTFHSGPDFHKRARMSDFGLPRGAKPWAVLQAPRD